ncbi:MAG: hypothetical protein R3C14_18930 [Caldilineaceae bacterium]
MAKDFPYSRRFDPPAPVTEITVSAVGEATLQVLIDTGADVSMFPISVLHSINARFIEKHRIIPVFGRAYTVDLYAVDVHLAGFHIPAIEVVALNSDNDPLIGRDVLNHLIVTLDGIGGVTEIS